MDLITWDEKTARRYESKLRQTRCLKDVKKYSFPNRCIDQLNSLDKDVVTPEKNIMFKVKFDQLRFRGGPQEHIVFPCEIGLWGGGGCGVSPSPHRATHS